MNSDIGKNLLYSPFIYTRFTVFNIHLFILACLGLQFLLLIVSADFYAVMNIVSSILACILAEMFFQHKFFGRKKINIDIITTAVLIGFFMPSGIGFIFVFFLSATSFFIAKIVFGGTGSNWVNPVAMAICIAYISKQDSFPQILDIKTVINYGGFLQALDTVDFSKIAVDFSFTSALNSIVLHNIGVTLPEGYISLFYNASASIPAFRYNIVTLVASIILFSFRIIDYILPVFFLLTYSLMTWIFSGVGITGNFFTGDILFALLTGGTLFSAVFIITESSSSPNTRWGKMVLGFLSGILAFFICGYGASPAGIGFVVIIADIFTAIVESIENKIMRQKRKLYG